MKPLKIGVLGGIGPEATGYFYINLIKRLQEKKIICSNADFPQIIINSIPAPELIFEKIKNEDLEPYIEGLKELDQHHPDFIIMVCNTIHLFYDLLQEKIKTKIIDLREVVEKHLKELNIKNITIIGTPSSISLGLYHYPYLTYQNLSLEEVNEFSQLIFKFNKGVDREYQIRRAKRIVQKHLEEGSQTILLACTEFAVMLNNLNIPKINTLDLLIDKVVDEVNKSRQINQKEI